MPRSAVFLDRDGVINSYVYDAEFGTVDSPAHPDQFVLTSGAAEAIAKLNQQKVLVVVVSNQPGIAKGKFSRSLLEDVTEKMNREVQRANGHLDGVYYCLHHPEGTIEEYRVVCDCRKPKPGLLLQAAQELQIDLAQSYMVGDGVVDILAGRQAGARTLFVGPDRGYVLSELERQNAWPNAIVSNLSEAAELICRTQNGHNGHFQNVHRKSNTSSGLASYSNQYLQEAAEILKVLDQDSIERMADLLLELRERGGRLFLLGVGGGAGHASHAACDFRKIAGIEAYAPSDNVSELTARVNDEGWDTCYVNWLRGSRLNAKDMVLVFSVGGGDVTKNVSANLVRALEHAKQIGTTITGVVGRDGGFTRQVADACSLIPTVNPATITPHTEAFQALVWHLLVSHPKLKAAEMKWESLQPASATAQQAKIG
ncbi:MAG TPA: HAD-IIIA family hydrolase [Candidatus Acidoferrales bacterium]|nr:HAD-IIIA family hydrolase [Candidatus Acidoferrales bacterium]